jgi:hypothetical protein
MSDKPELVSEGERLRSLYQGGKDDETVEAALSCYYGISEIVRQAEDEKDGRILTFAAPQISDLAVRLGWLQADKEKRTQM